MITMLTFDFPLPENLANHRMHWAVKHRRKEAYWELLDNRLLVKMLPAVPDAPLNHARAIVEVRTYRIMDRDGAVSRTKWIWDWLVTRGYLVADSPDHLNLEVEPKSARRSDVGITVFLSEVTA